MQQDQLAATDSTSQTGAESFRVMAEDSAKSIPPLDAAQRCVASQLRRCLFQKGRLVDPLRDVLIHQMPPAQRAQSWKPALALYCRRIPDNSFPKSRLHGHSTSQPQQQASAQRGLRCHKNATHTSPDCLWLVPGGIERSILPIVRFGTESFSGPRHLHRSVFLSETKSDGPANDRETSQRNIQSRLRATARAVAE